MIFREYFLKGKEPFMEYKNVIAIDAMGGDNAPAEIIKGAIEAINERADIKLRLFGDKDKIETELNKYTYNKEQIGITHTTEEISCNEAPAMAIKKKKDSSLVVAIKSVKSGECDAIVSAGSSGAILVGGQVLIGKGKGVKRAPLAPLTPTAKGVSLLIDCGANVDARPEHLLQFAQMGSIYMENILGIKNPRVAIVNIGLEEEKGNALVKETYPLLKECKDINFIGSIEARNIPKGDADVIVCDAFVGNVILKLYEGTASTLIKKIKGAMMSSFKTKIGALLIKKSLKEELKTLDATEYGGAPLIGLNGLVVKVHGNATSKEIGNALIQCVKFKKQKINEKITASLNVEE